MSHWSLPVPWLLIKFTLAKPFHSTRDSRETYRSQETLSSWFPYMIRRRSSTVKQYTATI